MAVLGTINPSSLEQLFQGAENDYVLVSGDMLGLDHDFSYYVSKNGDVEKAFEGGYIRPEGAGSAYSAVMPESALPT